MSKDQINYEEIIKKFPWIIEKGQKAVISSDADGMICGLFMSHFLDWDIVGYYDNGKNLLLKSGIKAKDCIFLDTEICRKDIKSCGHHIVRFRNKEVPANLDNFSNCLNPNVLRSRTLKDQFSLKYPMGTIHLLMCIVGFKYEIDFSENAFFPILQADGAINRFFDKYTENLIDWLRYLNVVDNEENCLHKIVNSKFIFLDLSRKYADFVRFYIKDRKDKIPISTTSNELVVGSFNDNSNGFSDVLQKQVQGYLKFISDWTNWKFDKNKWNWDNFRIYKFTKKICRPGVATFNNAVKDDFLSLAITATNQMEYTLEEPDKLP